MSGAFRTLAEFSTIAELNDESEARVLVTALKAHGFHPLEGGETGLPGTPGVRGPRGTIGVKVPVEEEADARLLAGALIEDMREA